MTVFLLISPKPFGEFTKQISHKQLSVSKLINIIEKTSLFQEFCT